MSQCQDLLNLFKIKKIIMHGKKEEWGNRDCWPWPFGRVGSGYGEVRLSPGEKPFYVHRLSAVVFLGYRFEKDVLVLHKCDNKPCFNPKHLYLGSRKDNARDAVNRGQLLIGERCPWAKLRIKDVLKIRELAKTKITQRELSERFNVTQSTIARAIHKTCWSSI